MVVTSEDASVNTGATGWPNAPTQASSVRVLLHSATVIYNGLFIVIDSDLRREDALAMVEIVLGSEAGVPAVDRLVAAFDSDDQSRAAAKEGESFVVRGREIYCHLRHGFADSLLTKGFLDKKLKILDTARNWRTVEKLSEI